MTLHIDLQELNITLSDRKIRFDDGQMYSGAREKYSLTCLECGNKYKTTYYHVINRKQKCSFCIGNKKIDFDIEKINLLLENRFIYFLSNQEYINARTKYKIGCKSCGYIWETKYDHIMNSNSGCPKCAIRMGEDCNTWKGGISKIYDPSWNDELKEFIRNRDLRCCQYPDCDYTDINQNIRIPVHHIDGNKKNCIPYNLISLCTKHHRTVEHNPIKWEDYFYTITDSYEI